jgi:hypothetical protein
MRPDGVGTFAGDLSEQEQRLVCATHIAPAADLFDQKVEGTDWKSKPGWYIVATKDRTVQPALQRFVAKRIGAATTEVDSSHVPMLSNPKLVLDVIRTAGDCCAPICGCARRVGRGLNSKASKRRNSALWRFARASWTSAVELERGLRPAGGGFLIWRRCGSLWKDASNCATVMSNSDVAAGWRCRRALERPPRVSPVAFGWMDARNGDDQIRRSVGGIRLRLALRFAEEQLPHRYASVETCFRHRGAYARFKDLLAAEQCLDKWYAFEAECTERALRDWCVANQIHLVENGSQDDG